MTDPQTPATEAGRALLADLLDDTHGKLTDRAADILAIEAEARADASAPLLHPDDGHEHRWGCRLCGVDRPPWATAVLAILDPETT